MKKTVLMMGIVAATIITTTKSAKAQEGLKLGIEGTPQMSWQLNKDDDNNSSFQYGNTFNGSFGISSQYGFNETMGVGLNVLYSFQGQQFDLNGVTRIKKVEYLKIPVMFTYNYNFNSDISFTGKIGPQVGIAMNAKLTDSGGNSVVGDQRSAYADLDFSGMASAGIGFKLSDNLFLDASLRYDYSVTDAENKDYKQYINNPSVLITNGGGINNRAMAHNMTAGVTIGIRYLIAKNTK